MTKFEAAGRTRKALKLSEVLVRQGATAEQAAVLPETHRRIVAELAGCPAPSEETWAVVVELVRAAS